ncbi:hypothetical protein [uncultured Roseobacter sp.]|uniref:hypothetical protein n=1 Tax=uncultured Roseobacter sp. TaxID=114847 RepID=UPI0026340E46|nr:hypothetical protein [uncultured Roseobacter sp.]
MIELLLSHTNYLARGFATNLLISVLSMSFGTVLGGLLGWLRARRVTALGPAAHMATNVCRNVPSFVLLFYMASMIPSEVTISGTIMAVPLWIKATLALTFPVIGFTSDQSRGYFEQRRAGLSGAAETFVVAWVQYFLIIIMASATASVIGADEIVGRANIVISQNESPQFLLITYLYVSLWFLMAGLLMTSAVKLLTRPR